MQLVALSAHEFAATASYVLIAIHVSGDFHGLKAKEFGLRWFLFE